MDNLFFRKFNEVDLADPFFDSLKHDYAEFEDWFNRKSENTALVLYNEHNQIEGFLYVKQEAGPGDDTNPLLPNTYHLKVGTFKFNPQGTRRGDRYIKKIFDMALAPESNYSDIYVTVFGEKHQYLVDLFNKYGFEQYGVKQTANGTEQVLLRDLTKLKGDIDQDYPFIYTRSNNKFLLSVYPKYHTNLFPDSKLHTESDDIVNDISHSNSIHKIYICGMKDVTKFQRGDALVIYRTSDGRGPAEYRSVATSLCVVENVHTIHDYANENDFVNKCVKFSVFSEKELRQIYREKKYPYVINFTYNIALPKRPTRQKLADEVGLSRDDYWGVMQLSNEQFQNLLNIAEVPDRLIVT